MDGSQSSEAVGSTEAKQGTDGQEVPCGWGLTFVQAGGNGGDRACGNRQEEVHGKQVVIPIESRQQAPYRASSRAHRNGDCGGE